MMDEKELLAKYPELDPKVSGFAAYGRTVDVTAEEIGYVDDKMNHPGWRAYMHLNEEVCQILGKALGYPWLKDDQINFPGATEADGVCVGDHVAESIAAEAAAKITKFR